MFNRPIRVLLLSVFIGLGVAGCEAPTNAPVDSGLPSYGALANQDVSTYYYPHRAGVRYVYSNRLTTEGPNGTTSTTGSNDTVRTLGHRGFSSEGDSIFAISVTYRTAFAGSSTTPLRYLPVTSSFGGAYVNSSTALQGETTTQSLATRATSTDSTTAPAYGRFRSLSTDLGGSLSSVSQTDTVYFSSNASHVALWEKTSNGSFIRSKDIFRSDISVSTGNEWSYSTWQTSTMQKIVSDNTPITVGSTNVNAIHTSISNTGLNNGSTSERFFATGLGPVRQVDSWWTTTDGIARTRTSLIRDGVVILDLDEVLSM